MILPGVNFSEPEAFLACDLRLSGLGLCDLGLSELGLLELGLLDLSFQFDVCDPTRSFDCCPRGFGIGR
jgi:hypothetical protein